MKPAIIPVLDVKHSNQNHDETIFRYQPLTQAWFLIPIPQPNPVKAHRAACTDRALSLPKGAVEVTTWQAGR